MLRITDLSVKRGSFRLGLNDLVLVPGDVKLLIGPNGSGKTTLLKAIAGIINYHGEISFDGFNADLLGFKDRAKIFGYLPQRINLSDMLVRDFILIGRFAYTSILSSYSKKDFDVVDSVASEFGVSDYLYRDISDLSQGEFQRVLLAKVFAQRPKVLLLDEPTTALDIGHKRSVKEQIFAYKNNYKDSIVLISTHEPELFETISNGSIMLKDGAIFKGGMNELFFQNQR